MVLSAEEFALLHHGGVVFTLRVAPELHDVDELTHVIAILLAEHFDRLRLETDVFFGHDIVQTLM